MRRRLLANYRTPEQKIKTFGFVVTIPGSDDVVMKTSTAQYKNEDISFHTVSTDDPSTLITIELNDGDLIL